MSAETDRATTPARGVVQYSKHLREHTGSRREEGIACKVLQGVLAPERVRLLGRCAFGRAARQREGEPSPHTDRRMPHTYTLHASICTCVQGSPQAPPFPRPTVTRFMSVCHQIYFHGCRSAILQALCTEITAAFAVATEDSVAGWPSFSGADVGIA